MKTLKAANEALKAGDAASARGLAKEAIEADGEAYEAWVMDGKAANALGALDDAVKSYERAIEIRSEHPAAYQGLNETYAAKGDVVGRLRALRALVDAHRASGKVDKLVEFLKQACACAWENAQWSRVIEFCGEMGELRTGEVDEATRVESVKRACDGALALRDARAAEAGEAAVQMLRSKTIASKAEEESCAQAGCASVARRGRRRLGDDPASLAERRRRERDVRFADARRGIGSTRRPSGRCAFGIGRLRLRRQSVRTRGAD